MCLTKDAANVLKLVYMNTQEPHRGHSHRSCYKRPPRSNTYSFERKSQNLTTHLSENNQTMQNMSAYLPSNRRTTIMHTCYSDNEMSPTDRDPRQKQTGGSQIIRELLRCVKRQVCKCLWQPVCCVFPYGLVDCAHKAICRNRSQEEPTTLQAPVGVKTDSNTVRRKAK